MSTRVATRLSPPVTLLRDARGRSHGTPRWWFGSSPLSEILRGGRPRQWVKNLLVLAAPGAAGVLVRSQDDLRLVGVLAGFCALASGVYLVNDVVDAGADRCHPRKRRRPVAAGTVSPLLAAVAGGIFVGLGLSASAFLGWRVLLICTIYVAVQLAYSLWLKHVPVVDLVGVASGFVLRVLAGAAVVRVPTSSSLLLVTTFGSLLIVAGKRYAEILELGSHRVAHRRALGLYSSAFLRWSGVVSGLIAISAYVFWAVGRQPLSLHRPGAIVDWLSVVPFALAVAGYLRISDAGGGGRPEDVFLSNRMLQLLVVGWVAVFALGVYTR
jgi:decaprenyl-phosphate phosphoribosyltransferase